MKYDYQIRELRKMMLLLKETSLYNYHVNNTAKTYLINSEGDYLVIGEDCFYSKHTQGYYKMSDDSNKVEVLDKKDYSISYGISLTNVILLLEKKNCEVINIVRWVNPKSYFEDHYKIFIIQNGHFKKTHCFYFKESYDLTDFATSELGNFLTDLYGIKDLKD